MKPVRRSWILRLAVAVVMLVPALAVVGAPSATAATQSCSSSTPVTSRPTLRYGDTGSCVKVLQNILLNKGYNIGASYATGNFYSGTELAVRRYQSTKLDLKIDGVVGPATWNRLVNGGGTTYSIHSGPNTSSRVVLSFDDCPKSYSAFQSAVLGAQSLGIALVLAPTGNCISTGRFSSSYARSHGHYVINHSISHPDLTTLSYSSALYQLGSPGVVTSYGRPPYGAYDYTVRNAYARRPCGCGCGTSTRVTGRARPRARSSATSSPTRTPTTRCSCTCSGTPSTSPPSPSMKSGLAAKGLGVCRNPGTTTPQYFRTIGC